MAIAKVKYLIINDLARCKVKQTIAVVSCVTVLRTECEAALPLRVVKLLHVTCNFYCQADLDSVAFFFSYERITLQFGFTIARVTTVTI